MAHEFVIKNGFISKGDSIVSGSLSGETLNLTTTPSNDNSQTQVLVRNNTSGLIEYRDASSLSGTSGTNTFVTGTTFGSNQSITRRNDGTDVLILTGGTNVTLSNPSSNQIKIDVNIPAGMNTYVTGFTYNDNNTFTIFDNDGSSFPATINQVSGLTVNGDITVTGTSNLNAVTATTVDFDLNYTGATDEGRLSWNSTDATLDLGMGGGNVTQQIGQEIYYRIKNQSGSTISNGRVVRNAGSVGASGRILGEYMIADGTYPFAKTLGIATEDILNGSDGLVTEFGVVRGLNTTGSLYGESWSDGDVLYVSSTIPGGLTNVEPQAPNQILEMGVVLFSNVGNGSIFVDRHLSTKLGDISDVQTTGSTNGDLIVYNSATTVWDYSKTLTGDYDINGSLSATTLDGNTILSGGTNLLTIIESLDTYVTGGTINLSATTNTNSATIGLLYKNSEGIPHTLPFDDTFTTGGTYDNNTALITFDKNDGSKYNVDLSTIDVNDTFVTGTTFGSNQAILTRNDGTEVFKLSGGTNVTLTNPSTNEIKIDTSDTFVTGYTYDDNNTFTISDNLGSAYTATINQVSGLTVNGTLSATTLDGNTILSGGTNLITIIESLDTYVTGGTVSIPATDNTNSATIGLLYKNSEGVPHTLPFEDTYTSGTTFASNQAILTRNDGAEIFKLSGGTNVTLSNPSTNQIKLDVTIPAGMNTYITGFTYDDANTLTISDNVGDTFPVTINTMTGLTVNGKVITTQLQVTSSPTNGYVLTSDASGNATWQAASGGGPTLRNVSGTTTFATANETINCTGNTFTVNLPTAVGIQGTTYTIVNSGVGVITLKGGLGQTMNGSLTIDLSTQYISRTVQSNGANWIII